MLTGARILLSLALFVLFGNVLPSKSIAAAQTVAAEAEGRGKTLHILAIGISKYEYYKAKETVQYAAKDAGDFASLLEQVARGSFVKVNTRLLLDEQATRVEIARAAEEMMAQAQPEDTFVFFYSGHGTTRTLGPKKEEQFYLLPTNFDPARGNSELYDKGISGGLLQTWFLKIQSQHQLVVLNSSRSGRGFEGFVERTDKDNKFLGEVARRDFGLVFIAKESYEFDNLKNGLLPYLLLEGLKGGAASHGGKLTVKKLIRYVENNSREVIKRAGDTSVQRLLGKFSKRGIPSSYFSGEDFPLGVKPGDGGVREGAAGEARPSLTETVGARGAFNRLLPANFERPDTSQDDGTEFILSPECAAMSEFRPSTSNRRRGKDHALLMATDTYDSFERWSPLNNPVFDATSIAEVLNTRFGFETEVVKNPNMQCFGEYLGKYGSKKYAEDEQLFIFIAGHGDYRSNIDGFLIVKDTAAVDVIGKTSVPHSLLTRYVNAIPCKHIFLVLDSCFGGAMARDAKVVFDSPATSSGANSPANQPTPDSDEELVKELMQYRTRRFLTSGGIDYVSDGVAGHHSPFANKFLAAFDVGNGARSFITVTDMIPKVKLTAPVSPVPLFDAWYTNDSRSEFFFFSPPPP